ncbi:putative JmjC domain-containing histone demethylation protein 2C [Coemansia sp. RSA 2131]|nr:putative JmjC domain-containing histone demethylation protein 2C [Coemansia sp. RSA 2131]
MVQIKASAKSLALLKQKQRLQNGSNQRISEPVEHNTMLPPNIYQREWPDSVVYIDNTKRNYQLRIQQYADKVAASLDSFDNIPLTSQNDRRTKKRGTEVESDLTDPSDLSVLLKNPQTMEPTETQVPMECGSSSEEQPAEYQAAAETEKEAESIEPASADKELAEVFNVPKFTMPSVLTDPLLDQICSQLPKPESLCSAEFSFQHLSENVYEPAHTLVKPREQFSITQAKFEYTCDDFSTPVDPALWKNFQQKKYARWAQLNPTCARAEVRLIPQHTGCASTNMINQPQCRACIGRVGGKRCQFINIRYATQLVLELTDGTSAMRYLICPAFRSQNEKAPAIRQPVMSIILPEDCVVDGDDSWIEFHILCQTVSSIKSLLRRELAVVRDVQVNALRGVSSGTVTFHDTDPLPQAEVDENGNPLHPLYKCAPSPCILRKMTFGVHQKCDICTVPIFSAHFTCCMCMQQVCTDCFSEWNDSDIVERCTSFEKGNKGQTDCTSGLGYCKRYTCLNDGKTITYSTKHKKRQFVRVSHFSDAELEMMMRKVNRIVQYCDLLDDTQPAGYSSISLCANALQRGGLQSRVDFTWINSKLDQIDKDTEVIANLGDADFGADPTLRPGPREVCTASEALGAGPSHSQSQYLEAQWNYKLTTQLLPSGRMHDDAWQIQPIYVTAENLTLREFARLWEEGQVIVVKGLLSDDHAAEWTPQALRDALGELPAQVMGVNMLQARGGGWTLRQYLQLFDESAGATPDAQQKKLLAARMRASVELNKAADDVHSDQLKAMCERARALLPFSQYTAADGQLNLVNRLPNQYARPPDFGPELHCMYGSQGTGSVENLRCEVADIVNLLVYVSSADYALPAVEGGVRRKSRRMSRDDTYTETETDPAECVQWDIYGPGTIDHVREFVEETASGNCNVMNGHVYMSDEQQAELYERSEGAARPCRVLQSVGDAVFVPAGSLYQRRTLRNTSSVQSKFLSPEHAVAARCVSSALTAEKAYARRREAVPVMDILWWTWMGSDAAQADEVVASGRVSPTKSSSKKRSTQTPTKRSRGRGKKQSVEDELASQTSASEMTSTQTPTKRGRGRGRGKKQVAEAELASQTASSQTPSNETPSKEAPSTQVPTKRGRGRGKQQPVDDELESLTLSKRRRGRSSNRLAELEPASQTPDMQAPSSEMTSSEMQLDETPSLETPSNEMPSLEMQLNETSLQTPTNETASLC